MTFDTIAFDDLLIGAVLVAIVSLTAAFTAALSKMKQPKLRPIPVRVRSNDVRSRRSIR